MLVFAVSGSGLEFRDSGLGRSQSRDPGIFSGLAIRQDFMLTGVEIGQILLQAKNYTFLTKFIPLAEKFSHFCHS